MRGIRKFMRSLLIALLVTGSLAAVSPAQSAPQGHHGPHRGWYHGRHLGWYHGRHLGWYHGRHRGWAHQW
jgi:hypothetical protein